MKPACKIALTIVSISFLMFSACKKNSAEPPAASADEALTDEEASFLESIPDTVIRLEDILLEDGENIRAYMQANDPAFLQSYPSVKKASAAALSPREQKNIFLARMFTMGNYLVDDSRHTFPSEGASKPAQTGLAYSWGSKDYAIRQAPPTIEVNGCNDLKIYGLDCTGMLWALTQTAGITVKPKYNFFIAQVNTASLWTDAFKASADYKDLKMEDKGQLKEKDIKNGDIIFWGRHVGVYINGWFYQSNGSSKKDGCTNNLSQSHGPRCISLSEILNWTKLGAYRVFRISYGESYTLLFAIDYSGASGFSQCQLVNCIDTTIMNITVTENDSVSLNYIHNPKTPISFETLAGGSCGCLKVSFISGSPLEFTSFHGIAYAGTAVQFTAITNYCYPTDVYDCGSGPQTSPGYISYGNHEVGGFTLPQHRGDVLTGPCSNGNGNGTLTVTHDL